MTVRKAITPEIRTALRRAAGGTCERCGTWGATHYEVDHKNPVAWGGTNRWDNLAYLCRSCNRSKGATRSRIGPESATTRFSARWARGGSRPLFGVFRESP